MYRDRTVSLVIPAYNEEETIADVVTEFRSVPHIDEIVVWAPGPDGEPIEVEPPRPTEPMPNPGCADRRSCDVSSRSARAPVHRDRAGTEPHARLALSFTDRRTQGLPLHYGQR